MTFPKGQNQLRRKRPSISPILLSCIQTGRCSPRAALVLAIAIAKALGAAQVFTQNIGSISQLDPPLKYQYCFIVLPRSGQNVGETNIYFGLPGCQKRGASQDIDPTLPVSRSCERPPISEQGLPACTGYLNRLAVQGKRMLKIS